jgi:hypothetical protein
MSKPQANIDDKVKKNKYYEWYEKQYSECIGLPALVKISEEKKLTWIGDAVKNFTHLYSSIWRHENLNVMKFYAIPDKTNSICAVFKARRRGESSILETRGREYKTSYGFLYCDVDGDKIIPRFICLSSTYNSADGEYRFRFIPFEQFIYAFDLFGEIFAQVEGHVVKQIRGEELFLGFEVALPPALETMRHKIKNFIDKLRISIKLYSVLSLIDFQRYSQETIENHVADGYIGAMFSKYDKNFYNDKKISLNRAVFVDTVKPNYNIFSHTPIGQKIIPLTVRHVEEIGKIRHAVWLELFVASHVGDLVINGICPSFPILNNWFLIQNNSKILYDNAITHFRQDNSKIATGIVKDIESARKHTFRFDEVKKENVYLSYSMEGLSRTIEISMDYAEEEMIMSNYSLGLLMDHIGRTCRDLPQLYKNSPEFMRPLGPLFSSIDWLAKYMFEYLYAIHELNTKLGIIHSDLHLNNVTTFERLDAFDPKTQKTKVPNPHVIYGLRDQQYIFPSRGRMAGIIDFSRAIIWPESHLLENLSPAERLEIEADQRRKILHVYERDLPEFFHSYQNNLKASVLKNYEGCFKLTTAIDAYKITSGFIYLFENTAPEYSIEVNPEAVPFLAKIQKLAFNYLTVGMIKVLKTDEVPVEWPLHDIITTFFEPYLVENFHPPDDGVTLIDYFSSNNTLRYNTREYEHFPPNIKFDYAIEHGIKEDAVGLQNYRKYVKQRRKERDEKAVAAIQQHEIETKPERRGSDPIALPKSRRKKGEVDGPAEPGTDPGAPEASTFFDV